MSKDKTHFHLPLNKISKDNKLTIVGKAGSEAIAHGNPEIIDDPIMGRCMKFDGKDDYVAFTNLKNFNFSEGMTFCGWVRFDELTKSSNIFNFSIWTDNNNSAVWLANGNNTNNLRAKYHKNGREVDSSDVIEAGVWQHLAYTYDIKGKASLYLNGEEIKSRQGGEHSIKDTFSNGYLGKSNYNSDDLFKGAMAHCRFYTHVLETEAIKAIMVKERQNAKVFHLPLDEIRYNPEDKTSILPNVGGFGSDAIIHGNAKIVYDPDMGTCLEFDGEDDYVELTSLESFDFKEGMTFMAWVRFDALNKNSRIFQFATKTGNNDEVICIYNHKKTSQLHFFIKDIPCKINDLANVGKWQHIAFSNNAKDEGRMYLNGKEISSALWGKNAIRKLIWKIGYLGKSNWSEDELFEGAMAHARIYKHAISKNEIKALMQADKNSMAYYRETSLLKVDLYTIHDDNHKPVLFIESANKSEPLELSLTNPSNKPVTFKAFSEPTKDNFQVQLRFRRNVIEPNIIQDLKDGKITVEGWKYEVGTTRNNREDYISFVRADGQPFTLNNGDNKLITLSKFSASARGGSRNTRIEVRFRTDVQDPGSVIRHMEVHSHLGLKTVPLIAKIKGSNTVLNDGREPNELDIEISYIKSKYGLKLNHDANNAQKRSRFTLIMDEELFKAAKGEPELKVSTTGNEQDGFELALDSNKKAQSGDTEVSKVVNAKTTFDGLNTQPKKEGEGKASFTFDIQKEGVEITPDNPITIKIRNWVTNAANGIHNLELRYEDIEGYWDGAWLIPIECNPLVIRGGNVGIGIDDPKAKLQVRNGAIMPMEGTGENTGIRFKPDAYGGSGDRAYIEYYRRGTSGESTTLKIANENDAGDHIALMPSGNVGIGTDNPIAKLDIQTKARIEYQNKPHPTSVKGLYVTGDFGSHNDGVEFRHTNGSQGIGFGYNTIYAAGNNDNQHLNLMPKGNGNVGIGIIKPEAKLQVRDGAIMPMEGTGENAGIRFKPDAFGGSGDRAYIEYYRRGTSGESTTLKIANENDAGDHIALMPGGNVGIGIDNPSAKLHVNGTLKVTNGQWVHESKDNNPKSLDTGDQTTNLYGYEVHSNSGHKRVTMGRVKTTIPIITKVEGKFAGNGEAVWISRDSYWWYLNCKCGSGGKDIKAQAICIKLPYS